MLELIAGNYGVTMLNDLTYKVGSADNVHSYDHEYHLDDARGEYCITSRHAMRLTEKEDLIASCILLAGDGASGVHEHSAIVHGDSCIAAVGPFMVSLHIPTLEIQWSTQTDTATCFGVYLSERHQCLISHGELEIARISFDGAIVWRAGGADIFTEGFELRGDRVHVVDFCDKEYAFDIETGREYAA